MAYLAAFLVQVFYAVTFTFANDLIDGGFIGPSGFILLRVSGATMLFWLFGFIWKSEKIEKRDFPTLFLAAVFGVAVNMLLFFKGLQFTTPIHAAVIMVATPIIVLILSIFFLNEKMNLKKGFGVFLGFLGAIILSIYGKSMHASDNIALGNLLVFVNAVSYSIYIIIIKKLTARYHPISFIKWLFLFGWLLVLPFGFTELKEVNWTIFSSYDYFALGWVIVAATFCTYLLNPLALSKLRASTVSTFIYLQPVFAGIFATIIGSDHLDVVKIIATVLIFTGVYLVSKK